MKKLTLISFLISIPLLATEVTATYTVPTPSELTKYASFTLKQANVDLGNSKVKIRYKLPLEIVTPVLNEKYVELEGTIAPFPEQFPLKSVNASHTANCFINKEGLTCLVVYDFSVEYEKVYDYLKTHYPVDFEQRAKVAKIFSNEPGGIVHFPLAQ